MRFELKISTNPQDYRSSIAFMEDRLQHIQTEKALPLLWFLEYSPIFTKGVSVCKAPPLKTSFPLIPTQRGGKITYHGPGQRIIYVMLNLEKYGKDINLFIHFLEEWIIEVLFSLGIIGKRCKGRTGVWVDTAEGEKKVAALGVRVHKWVTSHGIALNVFPDLNHYKEIVPCGLSEYGVTSLEQLGISESMEKIDEILLQTFPIAFQRIMKGSVDGYCKT